MTDLLAIFDVDGTLVDSQAVIVETMDRAFREAGLTPPARDAVLGRVGLSLPRMVAELLGDQADRAGDVVAGYRLAYLAQMEEGGEPPLYPGVEAGLARLRGAGVTLGVATGKSKRGLDRLVEAQGWDTTFATLQCADHHPSKPDPSMVVRALAETATEAELAVVIGDTTFDIEMAVQAGVTALGVSWGYHSAAQLTEAGAAGVCDTFDDVVARIEALR